MIEFSKEDMEALRELQGHKTHRMEVDEAQEIATSPVEPLREPQRPSGHSSPYQYYEPAEGTGGLPAVICTCGKSKHHLRMKVLQVWSEKHYNKTGHKPERKG